MIFYKKLEILIGTYSILYIYNIEKYQVPVTQMLSEKQDTLTIFYWLGQLLKVGVSIPQEVVCD